MNCQHCIADHPDKTVWDMIAMTAEKQYFISENGILKFLDWKLPLPCIGTNGKLCYAKKH